MKVLVLAEYYPRASDPVLGVWAHRQALAARDAGADVRVLVLHRPVPPLAALRARDVGSVGGARAALRQPGRSVLDGIEVRHPSHTAGTEARLLRLAQALDLGISGGSDWHGETEYAASHAPLGGMDVPEQWLHDLEQRRPTT